MAYSLLYPVTHPAEGGTLIERQQNCEVIVQLVKNIMEDE
jgi:hypothetical protein